MSSLHPIIIVDDDMDNRKTIQEGFVKAGCEKLFIHYSNGNELTSYLEAASREALPSIIILDIVRPGADNRQVLDFIKQDQRFLHIPVIIFTSSDAPKDRISCYELGANCYIKKPSGYQQILEIMSSIALLWCLKD